MKKLIIVVILSGVAGALSGCYTVRGVGEDVAATGRTVERAATVATPYPNY